jgi:hypothetical protein
MVSFSDYLDSEYFRDSVNDETRVISVWRGETPVSSFHKLYFWALVLLGMSCLILGQHARVGLWVTRFLHLFLPWSDVDLLDCCETWDALFTEIRPHGSPRGFCTPFLRRSRPSFLERCPPRLLSLVTVVRLCVVKFTSLESILGIPADRWRSLLTSEDFLKGYLGDTNPVEDIGMQHNWWKVTADIGRQWNKDFFFCWPEKSKYSTFFLTI